MFYFCGWQTYNHNNIGGFLLEAKAGWGHTCIAGGLFLLRYKQNKVHFSKNVLYRSIPYPASIYSIQL
jgi:hypothetical protein